MLLNVLGRPGRLLLDQISRWVSKAGRRAWPTQAWQDARSPLGTIISTTSSPRYSMKHNRRPNKLHRETEFDPSGTSNDNLQRRCSRRSPRQRAPRDRDVSQVAALSAGHLPAIPEPAPPGAEDAIVREVRHDGQQAALHLAGVRHRELHARPHANVPEDDVLDEAAAAGAGLDAQAPPSQEQAVDLGLVLFRIARICGPALPAKYAEKCMLGIVSAKADCPVIGPKAVV